MKIMKKVFLSILIVLFVAPAFAKTGKVIVNVSGIENDKGIVRIGIYNNAEAFTHYDKVFKGEEPKANKSGVSCTFTDIPAGTYAVAVWHDEDEDKTMNKNMFGAPKEAYGFSRNKFGSFGPPPFTEVSFEVKEGKKTTLSIKVE